MGWVVRCIRGGISRRIRTHGPSDDVQRWTVPWCTGTWRRFWRRIGHKVTGISRPLYPSLLFLPLAPFSLSVSWQELLRLYCWALKQRERRKNNTTLLPDCGTGWKWRGFTAIPALPRYLHSPSEEAAGVRQKTRDAFTDEA